MPAACVQLLTGRTRHSCPQALARSTVPLGYVYPGPDTTFTGWNIPDGVLALNLSIDNEIYPLKLPVVPHISTVTGASSAALGPVASPSMLAWVADNVAKTMPLASSQEDLLRGGIASVFGEGGNRLVEPHPF